MSPVLAAPLWQLLLHASGALAPVMKGKPLSMETAPQALRPGAQALCYAALRHWGWAQACMPLLLHRPPPARVQALLLTALAVDAAALGYSEHTLVDQAVHACKAHPALHASAGFMNAVLRRALREKSALDRKLQHNPVAQTNHPGWWIEKIQQQYPEYWRAMLTANHYQARMHLRVNRAHLSRDAYAEILQQQNMPHDVVGQDALALHAAVPVAQLPGFFDGWVSVQDAGAQYAAHALLEAIPPACPVPRVLDACAAPGGKLLHILENAQAHHRPLQAIALEVDALRAQRISDNYKRAHLKAEYQPQVKVADATAPLTWWDGVALDAILLDAPCTASGIVRRHPDILWLRRPEDIAQMAETQHRLLQALWPLLKPGGILLYCTCSVFEEEGAQVVDAWCAQQSDASCFRPHLQYLPTGHDTPQAGVLDSDGFFYAHLRKQDSTLV